MDTMVDVDDGDQKEYVKMFIKIFLSCDTSFIPIFKGKSNKNGLGTSGACWPP